MYPTLERMSDTIAVLQRAADSPKGIAINFPTVNAAKNYRLRLFGAIKALRNKMKQTFEPGHPQHGKTEFDYLAIYVEDKPDAAGNWRLIVRPGEVPALLDIVELD